MFCTAIRVTRKKKVTSTWFELGQFGRNRWLLIDIT